MKISIVTVCKNPGERIKKTVESVLAQTYKNIEYIVIDGASKDGTVEWLNKSASVNSEEGLSRNSSPKGKGLKPIHDSPLTIQVVSEPDTGIYNAMNKGIALASGDYILFLNAGDYLADNDVVSEVVNHMIKDGGKADIYFGDMISEDPISGFRYKASSRLSRINSIKLFFWCVPHAAAFIRNNFLNQTKGYDENFIISGDYDFFVKALIRENARYYYFPRSVSVFLTDGISSDPKYKQLLKSENLNIIKKYYGDLPKFLYSHNIILAFLRFIYKLWLNIEKHS